MIGHGMDTHVQYLTSSSLLTSARSVGVGVQSDRSQLPYYLQMANA